MRKTTEHKINENVLAVDINGLMAMLSCGEPTAKEIGELSKSRIPTSGRRVLYSVEKVRDYILATTY